VRPSYAYGLPQVGDRIEIEADRGVAGRRMVGAVVTRDLASGGCAA
jgi:hypothetical protein